MSFVHSLCIPVLLPLTSTQSHTWIQVPKEWGFLSDVSPEPRTMADTRYVFVDWMNEIKWPTWSRCRNACGGNNDSQRLDKIRFCSLDSTFWGRGNVNSGLEGFATIRNETRNSSCFTEKLHSSEHPSVDVLSVKHSIFRCSQIFICLELDSTKLWAFSDKSKKIQTFGRGAKCPSFSDMGFQGGTCEQKGLVSHLQVTDWGRCL